MSSTDVESHADVVVLGVPWDENSSMLRGAALGPMAIRQALSSGASNMTSELGHDLSEDNRWCDIGDLHLSHGLIAVDEIEAAVRSHLERGSKVLSLGGDHAVTYPILRAYADAWPGLAILHLDAHPDLYDEFEGNRYSHACPFARIMEENLASRLVQAGIRTMTAHQLRQVARFGVEVHEMRTWPGRLDVAFDGPVYLTIDLDALDPAFAPGVSHHEPGGFSTRDVLGIIHDLKGHLVGADVVELNPTRDPIGVTAALAAKLTKELLARMLCHT